MPVLTKEKKKFVRHPECKTNPITDMCADYSPPKTTISTSNRAASPATFRWDKVTSIRQELERGSYNLEKRLDTVIDKIFNEICN
jgi:hypothetical protein